jgi:HD-GYP domain-containing protein (c-di-GMP phosphodiesterase class II)
VADSVDAMLSPRSYKAAYALDRVRDELSRGSGRQFDSRVAAVAMEWLNERESSAKTSEAPAMP